MTRDGTRLISTLQISSSSKPENPRRGVQYENFQYFRGSRSYGRNGGCAGRKFRYKQQRPVRLLLRQLQQQQLAGLQPALSLCRVLPEGHGDGKPGRDRAWAVGTAESVEPSGKAV